MLDQEGLVWMKNDLKKKFERLSAAQLVIVYDAAKERCEEVGLL